jgi:hypothetical protein
MLRYHKVHSYAISLPTLACLVAMNLETTRSTDRPCGGTRQIKRVVPQKASTRAWSELRRRLVCVKETH